MMRKFIRLFCFLLGAFPLTAYPQALFQSDHFMIKIDAEGGVQNLIDKDSGKDDLALG